MVDDKLLNICAEYCASRSGDLALLVRWVNGEISAVVVRAGEDTYPYTADMILARAPKSSPKAIRDAWIAELNRK